MRGLTGALIGGGLILLVAVALYLRAGDEPAQTASLPRPGAAGAAAAAAGGASGARPGSMGASAGAAGGASRSGRVQERLDLMRADYEQRKLEGDLAPAASKREVPTAAARTKHLVENANKDLAEDSGDEDPEEMEELRTTLFNDPDPDERIGAVLMLTGDEGPDSMRMLIEAMDDPDAEVRLAVTEALGDRSEELSPATLAKAVNDPDPEVRFEAYSILSDMDDPEALQMLKAGLNDPDEDNRDLVAGALEIGADGKGAQAANAQQPTPK